MIRRFALAAGLLLVAAPAPAAERPLPVVAAPTPTAPFSATKGRLTFDRACSGLTLAALPGNAQCAARVGRGETGPTIEVSVATLQAARTPASVRTALALLDKALAAEDHPAAAYFAGTLVSTGELAKPDYPRALAYLERAVAGGNAAAADLLATLVLEGRGTAKDVERAIALLERAAAGGMDGSAVRLAQLYLAAVHVPRDPARGRGILEAAAAAGVSGAAEVLAMLDADAKIHNYQLHPSEDPAKVEVREYKTFDNPAIPPSFGFTDDVQRLFFSAYSDPAVLARLERDYPTLPTPYLYELARRMAGVSEEKAAGYFLLARVRMIYDAQRCQDPGAMEAIAAWDRLVMRDLRYALTGLDAPRLAAAVAFAREREAALPGDNRPWWVCHSGIAGFATAGGPPELKLKPAAEWPRLRQTALEALAAMRVPGAR